MQEVCIYKDSFCQPCVSVSVFFFFVSNWLMHTLISASCSEIRKFIATVLVLLYTSAIFSFLYFPYFRAWIFLISVFLKRKQAGCTHGLSHGGFLLHFYPCYLIFVNVCHLTLLSCSVVLASSGLLHLKCPLNLRTCSPLGKTRNLRGSHQHPPGLCQLPLLRLNQSPI